MQLETGSGLGRHEHTEPLTEDNQPETCKRAASSTKLCSKSLPSTWIWREAAVPLTEGKVPNGETAGKLLGQMSRFLKTRTYSLFKEREHKIQSKAQWEGMGVLRATLGISACPVAAEPSQRVGSRARSHKATMQPGHEGHQSLGAGIALQLGILEGPLCSMIHRGGCKTSVLLAERDTKEGWAGTALGAPSGGQGNIAI